VTYYLKMSMNRGRRIFLAPVVALTMALLASGCVGSDAPNADSPSGGPPTATATATATATPAATPTPAPSTPANSSAPANPSAPPVTEAPTAEPVPTATCDTVLTPEEYAALAEDSLVLRDEPQPFDDVMAGMLAEGALGCQWAGQGDVMVWFAQQQMGDAAWQTRRAELLAGGYTESNDPFPGALLAPADSGESYVPSVHYADGLLYFVSYARFLNSIQALQP
jgi:hypothetical protein